MASDTPTRFLVGPPVAGALDSRLGFRAPFILGVIITSVEFLCRLLIIDRPEAARWDASLRSLVQEKNPSRDRVYGATDAAEKREEQPQEAAVAVQPANEENTYPPQRVPSRRSPISANTQHHAPQLTIVGLLLRLLKSSRAMTPVFLTLIFGSVISLLYIC